MNKNKLKDSSDTITVSTPVTIHTGKSANDTNWTPKTTTWSKFAASIKTPTINPAKGATGAVVAAQTIDPDPRDSKRHRTATAVHDRIWIALDADNAHPDYLDTVTHVTTNLGAASATYSTFSHDPANGKRKYRTWIPLNRPVTRREHAHLVWHLASLIGADQFDASTAEYERLMYLPQMPTPDATYEHRVTPGAPIDVDTVLADCTGTPPAGWSTQVADDPAQRGRPHPAATTAWDDTTATPCRAVERVTRRHTAELTSARDRHPAAVTALAAVANLTREGHRGGGAAAAELASVWDTITDGENRHDEWQRMIDNAITLITDIAGDDPCDADDNIIDMFSEDGQELSVGEQRDRIRAALPHDGKRVADTWTTAYRVVANDPVLSRVGHNALRGRVEWTTLPPWRGSNRHVEVTDTDLIEVAKVFEHITDLRASVPTLHQVLARVAAEHEFNPWTRHVESLRGCWDGVDRWADVFPVADEHRAVTADALKYWTIGCVHLALNPGEQFDNVLILAGDQGTRKTSWFRAVVPDHDYLYELSSPPTTKDKDLMSASFKSALVVFNEIDVLTRRADTTALKDFVTMRSTTFRPAYGRNEVTMRRCFSLGGTTNEVTGALTDPTGGRRWWPVVLNGVIPAEKLTREYMDQLLAHALVLHEQGVEGWRDDAFQVAIEEVRRATVLVTATQELLWDFLAEGVAYDSTGFPVQKDISRVCVASLMADVPGLKVGGGARANKRVWAEVEAAMDAHPDYVRGEGAKQARIGGHRARVWWERIGTDDPSAALVRRALGESIDIADLF